MTSLDTRTVRVVRVPLRQAIGLDKNKPNLEMISNRFAERGYYPVAVFPFKEGVDGNGNLIASFYLVLTHVSMQAGAIVAALSSMAETASEQVEELPEEETETDHTSRPVFVNAPVMTPEQERLIQREGTIPTESAADAQRQDIETGADPA